MPDINATILIPDISGFTKFMTSTEISHGTLAINYLIDAILKAVEDEYEVSEIEGDAVLLIKKGHAPSGKEIRDTCLKIFNAFHFQRKWMEQYTVCPCTACQTLDHLTIKFVVHHGPVAEMKVGRFTVQSGTEMITAHRLLKNSIENHEYLLLTEKLMQQAGEAEALKELEWKQSSEEYDFIGRVDYRFASLKDARSSVPEPAPPHKEYFTDDTPYFETGIQAGFLDAYMVLMNIPARNEWMPGLVKVEQDVNNVFVGSIHRCTFESYESVVSPLLMKLSDDGIVYAEISKISDGDISLVYEYIFKKNGEKECTVSSRMMNAGAAPVPEERSNFLSGQLKQMMQDLKVHCEGMTAE